MAKVLAVFALLFACASPVEAQQVADPTFDTHVSHPAFTRWHPRILFDAAHHNVHRIDATYKAFADLARNDGCVIESRDRRLYRGLLPSYDILVIAGALGAALDDEARAKDPAFSADEVRVIREWVSGGGALLLLTDHDPVSSANAELTRAFGVESLRGVIVDSEHPLKNYYPSNIIATRANGLLRKDPLTRGVMSGRVRRAIVRRTERGTDHHRDRSESDRGSRFGGRGTDDRSDIRPRAACDHR